MRNLSKILKVGAVLTFAMFVNVQSAQATSINLTNFTDFTGILSFGHIRFNFTDANPLSGIVNQDGTFQLFSAVATDTYGRDWRFDFQYGDVVNGGTGISGVRHPAGNLLGGLTALGDYRVAGRNVNQGHLLPVFSRGSFAATIRDYLVAGQAGVRLATWLTLDDRGQTGIRLFGDPKLLGLAGNGTPNNNVPEPMSMSLLAMGLLGGGVLRKRYKH